MVRSSGPEGSLTARQGAGLGGWVSRVSLFSRSPGTPHRKSTSKPTNMESVYERFLLTGVWGSTAICFVLSSALKKKPHTCIARVSVCGASFSIPFSHIIIRTRDRRRIKSKIKAGFSYQGPEGRMKGELPRDVEVGLGSNSGAGVGGRKTPFFARSGILGKYGAKIRAKKTEDFHRCRRPLGRRGSLRGSGGVQ